MVDPAIESNEIIYQQVDARLIENENIFTKEFLTWNKDKEDKIDKTDKKKQHEFDEKITFLQKYEQIEEHILDKLETILSYMDNFIAFQAIFPSLERKTKDMKIFKPINFVIKQIAKIYIIMILIYLKKFLLRLRKINKLLKIVKTEFSIIQRNFLMKNANITEYHEKFLTVLYTEKIKAIIEIVGYINDLVLNLSLVTKRFRLGRMMGKFVGFVSWVVNIYRLFKDVKQEEKNEVIIKELEIRFGG
jgi:hypothetical protein